MWVLDRSSRSFSGSLVGSELSVAGLELSMAGTELSFFLSLSLCFAFFLSLSLSLLRDPEMI